MVTLARDGLPGSTLSVDAQSSRDDWVRALQDLDGIVHLAAIAHRLPDADLLDRVNVRWPLLLFEAAAEAGVAWFVFLSSVKVLGDVSERPFKIGDPHAPGDLYGDSKARAERGLLDRQATRPQIQLAILRPPLVYGPGVKANFRTLLRWARRGRRGVPLPFGAARAPRSLISVHNLCAAIVASCGRSGIYHCADEADLSVAALLEKLGVPRSRLLPLPEWFVHWGLSLLGRGDAFDRLYRPLQPRLCRVPGGAGLAPRADPGGDHRGNARGAGSMNPATVTLMSFMVSVCLTALLVALAPRFELLAHPNARSSHQRATPTLGGIAIVLPLLALLLIQVVAGGDPPLAWLLGAAVLLALIGLLDDLRDLNAGLRFLCQIVAVTGTLQALGLEIGLAWQGLIGLALLWHVNLFNFMDGIDGIAGVQTLLFCVGVHLLAGGVSGDAGLLLWSIGGAALGFLAFNWPPARIFMGDVGSLVLGLVLGVLVIELHRMEQVPFVASIILLSGFWFDASYTLCVRMLTGQPFTQAHRSHLYQRLSDRLGHLGTTSLFAALGAFWLFPLAWLTTRIPGWSAAWLAMAVLPGLIGAVVFRAGQQEAG